MTAPAFVVTFFNDYAAAHKREQRFTMAELAPLIQAAEAPVKEQLPWAKLARFGDKQTAKGSLRHDGNVKWITGIEGDADTETMSLGEAIERARKAGLACIFYTSPSHQLNGHGPRFRVLCPTSLELPPGKRAHLVGRLNGLLGGVLSTESFTLSQSFYYGRVNGNPAHAVEVIDGTCIDLLDELDETWIGKPGTKATKAAVDGTAPMQGPADEPALLAQITSGETFHAATVRLIGLWAVHGVPLLEAQARLLTAFDAVEEGKRGARWHQRRADVDRCLLDIYGKEGRERDAGEREREEFEQRHPPRPGVGEWPIPPDTDPPTGFAPVTFVPIDPKLLRPREYLIGRRLQFGKVSGTIAPPGASKTTLIVEDAIAAITGRAITGELVHRTGPALIICNEEDMDELLRRVLAVCAFFRIDQGELSGKLHLQSGFDHLTLAAIVSTGRDRVLICAPDIPDAIRFIKARGIVYTGVDPFVTTHEGEENDNKAIDFAARLWARVAHESGCALELAHHIVKSRDPEAHAGDLTAARGGGAFGAALRHAHTLANMGETSGGELDIAGPEWPRFVRMDDAKDSYSLQEREPRWFYRESVQLENGDEVGVIRRFDMAAKRAEAKRKTEAEREPERESLATVIAGTMTADEMPLTFLVPVVRDVRGVKDRRAKELIAEVIPLAPGFRATTIAGRTCRLWRRKLDPAASNSAHIVVRTWPDE